jgi:hypothetical protein
VREGFAHLGAEGFAFHTWTNTNYNIDNLPDPTMVSRLNGLATFQ